MSEPSKGAIAFATRIYAEMFGHVSTEEADVNRMVALAIAFDSCARAAGDQVKAEREVCAAICDDESGRRDGDAASAAADRIRARSKS